MPGTRKIDDRYNVTIRPERRRGGGWRAEGDIHVAATGKSVGPTVEGEGRTISVAEERAFAAARTWCLTHWIGRKRRSTERS